MDGKKKLSIIKYEDIRFRESEDSIKATFLKYYYFIINKEELEKIGHYKVYNDKIEFEASERSVTNKFNLILQKGLSNLKSLYGKETIYIHKGMNIPLIGTNEFGIVDRDTNLIELKPHSSCNLNCIYCSVDAGALSKKTREFVIEEKYLVEEFKKVAAIKKHPIEIQINPQGEPLMYSRIAELIKDLKEIKNVETVSMNSNGIMLNEELIKSLSEAGLDRINISLNTAVQETADKLAGSKYDLTRLKKMIELAPFDILIAPLIIPTYNDEELSDLIQFCKGLKKKVRFGPQNFLEYQKGRNPVKSKSWEWFLELLEKNEAKHHVKLISTKEDFNILEDERIPKPFKKNDSVTAYVALHGKYKREYICVASKRCITVIGDLKIGDKIKVRIVRAKHNIFKGII